MFSQHPHDALLERAWLHCRWGWSRVSRDPAARSAVEAWIEKFHSSAPRWLDLWSQIVRGELPERSRQLVEVESYFSLGDDDRGFWRPVVQSHPFAALLTPQNLHEPRTVPPPLP